MISTKKNCPKRKKRPKRRHPRRKNTKVTIDVRIDVKPCPLGHVRVRRIVETTLESIKTSGDVSIYVTDDSTVRKLNRRYLGRNRMTDVLAFPLDDETDEKTFLGEVVVSGERALKRVRRKLKVVQKGTKTARKSGSSKKMLESEIARYIIHGVLHLAGYEDSDEKSAGRMRKWEDKILTRLKFRLYAATD
jgi:probable rRNA maturation factor